MKWYWYVLIIVVILAVVGYIYNNKKNNNTVYPTQMGTGRYATGSEISNWLNHLACDEGYTLTSNGNGGWYCKNTHGGLLPGTIHNVPDSPR